MFSVDPLLKRVCLQATMRKKGIEQSENRKRFNIDHLNVFNIYHEREKTRVEGRENGSICTIFYYFRMPKLLRGWKVLQQMCKKLNGNGKYL
jgi:hypothetical protein